MLRTAYVTIPADAMAGAFPSRDAGKTFKITEMDAEQAEWWGVRALRAVAASGMDIGGDPMHMGMRGVAARGIAAFTSLPLKDVKELMDEMFTCISIVPDHGRNPTLARPLVKGDVEEAQTRLMLRMEVLKLHTGFSMSAGGSMTSSTTATDPATTSTIETSPQP